MSKQINLKQFRLAYIHSLVLFDPKIGPYMLLPPRAIVGLGAMTRKGHSATTLAQISTITGGSQSDCLVSYPGHSKGGGYFFSAGKQLVYSPARV